jgi:hypothetical protein
MPSWKKNAPPPVSVMQHILEMSFRIVFASAVSNQMLL